MIRLVALARAPRRTLVAAAFVAALTFGSALVTFGQGTETEPNDSCAKAQDLGQVAATTTLTGTLGNSRGTPDVDFFRFTASPNLNVTVDLEGQATGRGTLGDPFLGAFNADCVVQWMDDDSGQDLNSRLNVTVPPDGVVVLGVTTCCDTTFSGGGSGTYSLTVRPIELAGSISGRVVDATDGTPLVGDNPPYISVELRRCSAGRCGDVVAQLPTSRDGSFRFVVDANGSPLFADTYQIAVSAGLPYAYQPNQTAEFAVGKGQDLDVGDVALAPFSRARSIGGRIVDARTGTPLPGTEQPLTRVELRLCDVNGCYNAVASQSTDAEGRFEFDRDYAGNQLLAAGYRIVATATGYATGESDEFAVGADAAFDLGDYGLNPLPLVGSISGRVVDAVSGAPLRGDTRPFVRVELRACERDGCFYGTLATTTTDAAGRFRFTADMYGNPLVAKDYQVYVAANQYQDLAGAQFSATEGQHMDLGSLPLRSHPLRFTEIRPCGNLPLEGGDCAYSVRVTNGLSTTLEGGVWSLVATQDDASGSLRPLFQAGDPVGVQLTPGMSQVIRFQFSVPASAPSDRPICAEAIGGRAPDPYFDVLGRADLFCITKSPTGFAALSDAAANALRHPQADDVVPAE